MAFVATAPSCAGDLTTPMERIESWYNAHGEAVYRRCRIILNSDAAAWDATQEVFVRAQQALPRFRNECAPSCWLLGIANRYCFGVLRQSRQRELLLELRPPATPPDQAGELEAFIGRGRLVGWLVALFSDDVREIVALRFFEELEHDEIAAQLGISRKTVQRKLNRFLERSRRLLLANARERGEEP